MKRENQTPTPLVELSGGGEEMSPLQDSGNLISQPFDAFVNNKKKCTKEQDVIIFKSH